MRWYVTWLPGGVGLIGVKGEKVVWTSTSARWAKGNRVGLVRMQVKRQGGAFYEVVK